MPRKSLTATPGQILELVRSGNVTTRRELQEQTGLSRSTLALRLAELTAGGYLRETGMRPGVPDARQASWRSSTATSTSWSPISERPTRA